MGLDQIIGQQRAVEMLRRALERGRLHHSLLFCGPPGVGKWTTAQAVAAALLCEDGGCGRCVDCLQVHGLIHPDVEHVWPLPPVGESDPARRMKAEREALADLVDRRRSVPVVSPELPANASIGIGWIRVIQKRLALRSHGGRCRIVLIRDADRMNTVAANAFLKTLEEPPPGAMVILTSSAPSRLLPTILSRCQRVPFRSLGSEDMECAVESLKRRVANLPGEDDEALAASFSADTDPAILQQADGSPGRWVGLVLDGLSTTREKAFEVLGEGIGRDVPGRVAGLGIRSAAQCEEFVRHLASGLRDVVAFQGGARVMNLDRKEEVDAAAGRVEKGAAISALGVCRSKHQLLERPGTQNVHPSLLLTVLLAELSARGV